MSPSIDAIQSAKISVMTDSVPQPLCPVLYVLMDHHLSPADLIIWQTALWGTDHIANMCTWKKQTWTCGSVRIYCKVTQYCTLPWWSLLEPLSWCTIFKSSNYKSLEDQVPRDLLYVHDDVIKTFSALLALCAGNSPGTDEFPAQRPVTRSFDVSLICAWMNDWVNKREAGDLKRHRAHCHVIVMKCLAANWQEWQSTRIAILVMVVRRFILFSSDLAF